MTPKSQVIGRTQFHIDNSSYFKLDADSLKQVVDKGNLCNQEYNSWNPMRVISNYKVCGGAVPAWTNDPSFNAYDITKPCVGDNCYDLDYLASFFNRPDVLQELGIKDLTW